MLRHRYEDHFRYQVGTDEAGRGCLAGPVVAAAVLFPENYQNEAINDSKKLHKSKRDELRKIIESDAISYAVGICDHLEIDQYNILWASVLAMHKAIDQISHPIDLILVDGNKFKPHPKAEHRCIVKGDSKFIQIAAASILAKTYRDDLMIELDNQYPEYQFRKNKGYPSPSHIVAIKEFGYSNIHRKSFVVKSLVL